MTVLAIIGIALAGLLALGATAMFLILIRAGKDRKR